MDINPYEPPKAELMPIKDGEVIARGRPCDACGSVNTSADVLMNQRPSATFALLFGWVFLLFRKAFTVRADHCRDCGATSRYRTTGSWVALAFLVVVALLTLIRLVLGAPS